MAKENIYLGESLGGEVYFHDSLTTDLKGYHRHDELEFNLVTHGRAAYLVDDSKLELSENTLIWLYADQKHWLVDRSQDFMMYIVVFRPTWLAEVCRHEPYLELLKQRPSKSFCKKLFTDNSKQLQKKLKQHIALQQTDKDQANALLAWTLLQAWQMFLKSNEVAKGMDVHPAVEKAAHLIRNEQDIFSLEMLAEEVGLSPAHLSKLFKKQLGISLVSYRQRQQLERFFEHYGKGRRLNFTQAAYQAGFGSYPQFYRVFTQLVGMTPAAYRKQLRAN